MEGPYGHFRDDGRHSYPIMGAFTSDLSERRCGAIFSAVPSPILVLAGMKYILSSNASPLARFWALS